MSTTEPFVSGPYGLHTNTAILLHGRGSNGPEFAEDFLSSQTVDDKSLTDRFPGWRWVFPTSRTRWSTRFEEEIYTWFDAYSLTDTNERSDLQLSGLRESVADILEVIEREIELLNGRASRIYIGGISQGMATALWTFLCCTLLGRHQESIGGFLGFCGWLPFANRLECLHEQLRDHHPLEPVPTLEPIKELLVEMFPNLEALQATPPADIRDQESLISTPVFLSHGTDDIWVPVELGRQAAEIFKKLANHVEWNEFTGAKEDGHWIKEPEGFDQIIKFLEKQSESKRDSR
jgi:predicted esterase